MDAAITASAHLPRLHTRASIRHLPLTELGLSSDHPRVDKARARAFYLAYALLLFGAFAYFMPASTWSPVSRLGLTRAVVERGVLDVDPWADATGDRAFRGGHWYTDKAPVPSFLAIPAYLVDHAWDSLHGTSPQFVSVSTPEIPARHVTVNHSFARSLYVSSVSTAALAGVAASLLVFLWLRRRFAVVAALAGSACVALGTPLFPYATSFYGHVLAAAFLMGGFVLLTSAQPTRRAVRVAGLLLVLACGCEYLVALPVAMLVAASLVRARRAAPRLALDLAMGGLLPGVGIGAYHLACFGHPFTTGYAFLPRAEFAEGHARGFFGVGWPKVSALAGLLVGPRRGLFLLAPVAAVGAVLGLGVRAAKGNFDERVAALLTAALYLANAGYYMWWGGAATGPRHLVPVLPFLGLGVAWAWQYRWLRWVTVAAALVSFANMLVFTAVGLEAPEHGSALGYAWQGLLARHIAHLSGASNLGMRVGLPRDLSLAPLLVWLFFGLRYLVVGPVGPSASIVDALGRVAGATFGLGRSPSDSSRRSLVGGGHVVDGIAGRCIGDVAIPRRRRVANRRAVRRSIFRTEDAILTRARDERRASQSEDGERYHASRQSPDIASDGSACRKVSLPTFAWSKDEPGAPLLLLHSPTPCRPPASRRHTGAGRAGYLRGRGPPAGRGRLARGTSVGFGRSMAPPRIPVRVSEEGASQLFAGDPRLANRFLRKPLRAVIAGFGPAGPTRYVQLCELQRTRPRLAADVVTPPQTGRLYASPAYVWICGGGTINPLHFDFNEALLGQIVGEKRFLLFPPADTPKIAGLLERVALSHDLARFSPSRSRALPLLDHTTPYEAVVGPGDLLYIPYCWWHAMTAAEPSISVTWWWEPSHAAHVRHTVRQRSADVVKTVLRALHVT